MGIRKFTFVWTFLISLRCLAQGDCTPNINTTPLFSGKKTEYYQPGVKKSECNYLNDQLNGECILYYPNGKIRSVRHYRDDYRYGNFKTFYESGKVESTGYESYGKLLGSYASWYENGNLRSQLFYVDGQPDGDALYYYDNGKLELQSVADKPKREIRQTHYYNNGQLEYKLTLKDNAFKGTGEFLSYWPNGRIKCRAWYVDGKCSHAIELYSEKGILAEKLVNTEHGLWSRVEYTDGGKISAASEILPPVFTYYICNRDAFVTAGTKLYFDAEENPVSKEVYYSGKPVYEAIMGDTAATWQVHFDKQLMKEHLMWDSARYNPLVTGTLHKGVMLFSRIQDVKGKVLLRHGSGSFFGLYYYVSDWESYQPSVSYDLRFRERQPDAVYSGLFYHEWRDFLELIAPYSLEREGYWYNDAVNYAKGKFKNGLKQGPWIEGDFFRKNYRLSNFDDGGRYNKLKIDPDEVNATYATGNYVNGKKDGIWKLIINNFEVSGYYVNGLKEGKWMTVGRKMKAGYESYAYDEEEDAASQVGKLKIEGYYKNNKPDSIWKIYGTKDRTGDKELLYDRGEYLGVLREYYPNGKLKVKGIIKDHALSQIVYSPLGDTVGNYNEYNYPYTHYTRKNGKPDGPFYTWDQSGHIVQTGRYSNGVTDGEWLYFGYDKDTTCISHHRMGKMHGWYHYKDGSRNSYGMYENGERVGLWVDSSYNDLRVTDFKNGREYLLEFRKENQVFIKKGKGMVVDEEKYRNFYSPYDVARKETYYEDGLVVRIREYYQGHRLKSDVVKTTSGQDSLVTYNSPFGGVCVNSGEGTITELDKENRILSISFYEAGRLQKKELYNKGKYYNTLVYFPSRYDIAPEIYRTVTHLGNGQYHVEYRISKLEETGSFLKLMETVPAPYKVTASESQQYRHGVSNVNVNVFIWSNNKEPEIYCGYNMQLPKGELLKADFPATLHYIKNGLSIKVNLKAANVVVN